MSSVAPSLDQLKGDLFSSGARAVQEERFGWQKCHAPGVRLYFKGYIAGLDDLTQLANRFLEAGPSSASALLSTLDGHFALIVEADDWAMAATDRIGSIPLAYAYDGSTWIISGEPRFLADRLGLNDINPQAVQDIAMAGYTIGSVALRYGLKLLGSGEWTFFTRDAEPTRGRYYAYLPRPEGDEYDSTLRTRLADVTLGLFEKMVAGLNGQAVIIPLSAGLDSRLVLCSLREVGYTNVKCYSYGRPGNHEAAAAKRIAHRLGVPWTFVEHSPAQQTAAFSSKECRDFEAFADTLQAIPFHQEFYAVGELRRSGYASPDAVFVNGQSGDFLTGNHIPASLWGSSIETDIEDRWRRLTTALIDKHFSLWEVLKTPAAISRLRQRLKVDIEAAGGSLQHAEHDFACYELSEFQNRQSKYVVAGQRTYEWHGFDWRLPLWDRDYLEFWAKVPLAAKRRRSLFRAMLIEENLGGVWGDDWDTPQYAPAPWVRGARLAAKAVHAPLLLCADGHSRWHRFVRRYLDWWMDPICNYAIVSYGRVVRDRRGHRNAISWHAERYLANSGRTLEDLNQSSHSLTRTVRVMVVARLFSGLADGLAQDTWRPHGVPSMYKLLEGLAADSKVELLTVFACKSEFGGRFAKARRLRMAPLGLVEILPWRKRPWLARLGLDGKSRELVHLMRSLVLYLRFRPDVVYFTNACFLSAGIFARLGLGSVILRFLGLHPEQKRVADSGGLIERWLYRSPFAKVICSMDGSGGSAYLPRLLAPNVSADILLNGVDRHVTSAKQVSTLRARLNLGSQPVVLFMGRLEPNKGCREFVDSLITVCERRPTKLQAVIVGDGSQYDALSARIDRADAHAWIHLAGAVPHADISTYLALADIYVSLNRYGNLSNANLEALAAGKCMIILDSDAITHVDEETTEVLPADIALRVGRDDVVGNLTEELLFLVDQPARVHELAEAAARQSKKVLRSWGGCVAHEIEIIRDTARIAS